METYELTNDDFLRLGVQFAEQLRQENEAEREFIKRESAIQTALAHRAWERLTKRRGGNPQVESALKNIVPARRRTPTAVTIKATEATISSQPDPKEIAREIARQVADLAASAGMEVVLSPVRMVDRAKKVRTRNKHAPGKTSPTKKSLANQALLSLANERRGSFIKDGYPEAAADRLLAEQFYRLSAEGLHPLVAKRVGQIDPKTIRRTDVYERWKIYRRPKQSRPGATRECSAETTRLDVSATGISVSGSLERPLKNSRGPLDELANRWAGELGSSLPATF